MNLKKLVDLAGAHARIVMIDLQQDLMPTWVMVDKRGKVNIVGTPWENDQEKILAEKRVKAWMRDHDIVRYSFVLEAWQAVLPAGVDPDNLSESDRPRNRADRVEVVVACATDDAKAEWRTWKTIRNETGRVIDLEPFRTDSEAEPEGWMRDMLDF